MRARLPKYLPRKQNYPRGPEGVDAGVVSTDAECEPHKVSSLYSPGLEIAENRNFSDCQECLQIPKNSLCTVYYSSLLKLIMLAFLFPTHDNSTSALQRG